MAYPFPTRTLSSSPDEHLEDHLTIGTMLGRTPLTISRNQSHHLPEHNDIRDIFSLPARTTFTSPDDHLDDHTYMHSNIIQMYAGPRGAVGPQSDLYTTQPPGSVIVSPGTDSIFDATAAQAAGTTFWVRSGTHTFTKEMKPKTGNQYLGEPGAICDGTGWTTSNYDEAAFSSRSGAAVNNVTIANLVIRNMPGRGIATFYSYADNWTIDHCEVYNTRWGVQLSLDSVGLCSYTKIHDNIGPNPLGTIPERGGGYGAFSGMGMVWSDCEIGPGNGPEQKITPANIGRSNNTRFVHCYVHGNYRNGIWYDGPNQNYVIEWNRIEDTHNTTTSNAIDIEQGHGGVVRYNYISTSSTSLFLSVSNGVEAYDNVIDTSVLCAISFWTDGREGTTNPDGTPVGLFNNYVHNNILNLGTPNSGDALRVKFGSTGFTMTSDFWTVGTGWKNNLCDYNRYQMTNTAGNYWYIPNPITQMGFASWQALGQDVNSTIEVG